MLLMTRRTHQQAVVYTPRGEEISVMMIALNQDHSHIGIDAPEGFAIHRKEDADAMRKKGQDPSKVLPEKHCPQCGRSNHACK